MTWFFYVEHLQKFCYFKNGLTDSNKNSIEEMKKLVLFVLENEVQDMLSQQSL